MSLATVLTLMALGATGLVWLARRCKLSPVLAYLALGIGLAPFQGELFPEGPRQAEELAEIGVILLMFFLGLEFHLDQLKTVLRASLLGGLLQIVVTAAAVVGACMAGGLPLQKALVAGVMIAFSSTALVMKAYEERGEADSHLGRVALSVLLLQDLAAIVALTLLPFLAGADRAVETGHDSGWRAFERLGALLLLLPVLFLSCRKLLPSIFARAGTGRDTELFALLSLSACFLVAVATKWAGGSLALGAFMGGLALSQTPFAVQVSADLATLRHLALAFFFVTIGLLVDFGFVREHAGAIFAALLLVLAGKTLLTTLSLRSTRLPWAMAASAGLALAQIGEFSFVISKQALDAGILAAADHRFLLSVSVVSMLVTPLLVSLGGRVSRWGGPETEAERRDEGAEDEAAARTSRAVVVGYGPTGRILARLLQSAGIETVVVEMNLKTVEALRKEGRAVIFGDASRRQVLKAAGADRATHVLVTLADLPGRMATVGMVRLLNPKARIIARARYIGERAMLTDAGADVTVSEELEVAVALAAALLRELGWSEARVGRTARKLRAELEGK